MVYVWGVTGKEYIITPTGDPGGERTSIRVDERRLPYPRPGNDSTRQRSGARRPRPMDGEPSDDYDLNSFAGIVVKDFGLKLTGPRAGASKSNGWNGVSVGISDTSNIMHRAWTRYPADTHLHLLLTPLAPLLDGSQGWPVDIDYDLAFMAQHQDNDGLAWSGIPYSRYRVTARYSLPGGRSVPTKVDVGHATGRLRNVGVRGCYG